MVPLIFWISILKEIQESKIERRWTSSKTTSTVRCFLLICWRCWCFLYGIRKSFKHLWHPQLHTKLKTNKKSKAAVKADEKMATQSTTFQFLKYNRFNFHCVSSSILAKNFSRTVYQNACHVFWLASDNSSVFPETINVNQSKIMILLWSLGQMEVQGAKVHFTFTFTGVLLCSAPRAPAATPDTSMCRTSFLIYFYQNASTTLTSRWTKTFCN